MEWIAGIDAGGTRTRALVAGIDGAGGGYGEAGPGNPAALGVEPAAAACRAALNAALRAAGAPQARLARLAVCAAGAGRPQEQAALAGALQTAAASVEVWPDAAAGLAAGSPDGTGVCLIAGTGSLAYGRDPAGRTGRAGGWGYLLGDEGGGFAIGREALRAALRASEGSGPPTALLERILSAWGLDEPDALLSRLYTGEERRERISALAPLVAGAAAAGDAVAAAILREAGNELAALAARCAAQLGLGAPAIVRIGGLWRCAPLQAAFAAALARTLPGARSVAPEIEPVGGAALLALGPPTAPERNRWIARLGAILAAAGKSGFEPSDATPAPPAPASARPPGASPVRTGLLLTEQRSPHVELDTLSPLEFARVMNAEDAQVTAAVGRALPQIAEAIARIQTALRAGRRLIYVGAGTSGRLGVLDAAECPPTFGVPPTLVSGLIAGGEPALTRSMEGAEDDEEAGAADLRAAGVQADDVVVGLAASGRTPYVLAALREATRLGATTVGVTCAPGSPLLAACEIGICAAVGPEVLTGSTRLKAGTAQKQILNMLSTGGMIGLGKVYQNLMVDVVPSNAKLRERAVRIVTDAAGLSDERARALLAAAGGHCKTAIVMALAGCDAAEASRRLEAGGGFVREAVALRPAP